VDRQRGASNDGRFRIKERRIPIHHRVRHDSFVQSGLSSRDGWNLYRAAEQKISASFEQCEPEGLP
jgi:hypothetical protein